MKKPLLIFIVIVIVLAVGLAVWAWTKPAATNNGNSNTVVNRSPQNVNDSAATTNTTATNNGNGNTNAADDAAEFATPLKTPHFESSTPAHGETLPAPPVNVVIDFNFDLAAPSDITIVETLPPESGALARPYHTGTTTIDQNKLALRRGFNPEAPDGDYTVSYTACWPDGSCHDGSFEFAIDRDLAATYQDFTSENAVEVSLVDFSIATPFSRVARGTTVTWTNDGEVGHYVNTDSHPWHTYFPDQNSGELLTGDSFVVTFDEPGYYPYHCSAHPDTMRGAIIVE